MFIIDSALINACFVKPQHHHYERLSEQLVTKLNNWHACDDTQLFNNIDDHKTNDDGNDDNSNMKKGNSRHVIICSLCLELSLTFM